MKIPKKIFTNEHLELLSSGQIRIPNKVILIPQQTFQFWSFSSKFEEGDSNPLNGDSNPNSSKVVEIDRFESPIKRFESLVKKKVK